MKYFSVLFAAAALLLSETICTAQQNTFTIQGEAANAGLSLVNTAAGKAVIKNCSSIEPISMSSSEAEYFLAVSAKALSIFHTPTATAVAVEKIKDPGDCYDLKALTQNGKRILIVYTTTGRKAFLLGTAGILYPTNPASPRIDDIDNISQTDSYLSIGLMFPDGEYGEGVIDWEGTEVVPAGKHVIESYDNVNDLFIVSHDKHFGAISKTGVSVIPIEYTRLVCGNGYYIARNENDRIGIVSPNGTQLPFVFTPDPAYGLDGMYKNGVFRLSLDGAPVEINATPEAIKQANEYLATRKNTEYYSTICTTVYQDRQFADEEVVAHIVNNDTKQITIPSTYIIGIEHAPHMLDGGVGVIKDGKMGMINCETGEIMIPLEYDPVYLKDIAPGQRYLDNTFSLSIIARDRKDITENPFMLILKKNGKFGITDTKGNVLVPFVYEEIAMSRNCSNDDVIRVKKDGMYGLIDKNTFAEVIPCEYEYMIDCSSAKKFKSDKDTIKINLRK
jgi:hypothetical protein